MVDPASTYIIGAILICVESATFAGVCSAAACIEVGRLCEGLFQKRQLSESFKKLEFELTKWGMQGCVSA